MQTFLPFPSYEESAACLDRQRLGKQRIEVLQLCRAITEGGSYSNHPAAKMWEQYIGQLVVYGQVICREWTRRGYRDTCYDKISVYAEYGNLIYPFWIGNKDFHDSHKSNLLRKDPIYYSQFNFLPNNLPYVWPVL